MKLFSFLRRDRFQPGVFVVMDADTIILGPTECRGEADNAAAVSAGNPGEDPTQPYGDHPAGISRVTEIVEVQRADRDKFGPFFFKLDPVHGEALRAKEAGRTGIGLHGGKPGQKGTPNELRATFGCLRLDNGATAVLAGLLRSHLAVGRVVLYESAIIDAGPDAQ